MGRAEDLFKRIETQGETVVDEFIADRKSEELFLDFKRSSDNGSGPRLSDTDRNNLAKAISGFGNSEGGVVVWGVDCSQDSDGADVARFKVQIVNVVRFASWLEGAVSGCTVPPHQGVRSIPIVTQPTGEGFVATLIPKSNHAPHQVVGRLQYFIRAGSDFVPTPHSVLAGMFGRLPQPHVFHNFSIGRASVDEDSVTCSVGVIIWNDGPGIASDLFVNILVLSQPGDRCEFALDRTDPNNWSGVWSFGRHMSLICHPSYRLPPEARVQPLVLNLRIAPPFNAPIHIEGMVGAGSSPPYRFKLHQEPVRAQTIYEEFMLAHKRRMLTDDQITNFAPRLLALEEKDVE
jgi:hypothetical protein